MNLQPGAKAKTSERHPRILELHRQGVSRKAIAIRMGMEYSTVIALIRKLKKAAIVAS